MEEQKRSMWEQRGSRGKQHRGAAVGEVGLSSGSRVGIGSGNLYISLKLRIGSCHFYSEKGVESL